jgi:hypothetical protein
VGAACGAVPRPLPLLLSSLLPLLGLLLELLPLLVELAGVPVVPDALGWRADRTATARPVPPIPSTAVATAAAPARRSQRERAGWGSIASEVTMPQTFAVMASGPHQENIKPESSSPETTL